MTKNHCLRVCEAYAYRLPRRRTTLVLVILLITITIISKLFANKHRQRRHEHVVGDYDYQPATFLRGQQPGNISYCNFNYGLPENLYWNQIPIDVTPELREHSKYRVIYNAIQGSNTYYNYTQYNAVTYATHATPEFLYHITEIAKYWEGPISIAVYVPSYDLSFTMQIMSHLCHCYEGMAKVSMHLYFPLKHQPILNISEEIKATTEVTTTVDYKELLRKRAENYRNLNEKTRATYVHWVRENKAKRMMRNLQPPPRKKADRINFPDCSGIASPIKTYRQHNKMIYPINVARNIARNASTTNYLIVSDIEMVPSDGLATRFLKMLRYFMGDKARDAGLITDKTIFVVPLFEVERGEQIPRDKDTLVRLVSENRATYFHQKICSHCQRFPGLQTWLTRSDPDEIVPLLVGRREFPYHRWEPLYFGTNMEPWYSEQLSWEGKQDKMTQMLELCLKQYRVVILDGGFLSHAAVSKPSSKYQRAEQLNNRHYLSIVSQLKSHYGNRRECKIK